MTKFCNKCKKPINQQQQRKVLGKDYHSYCAPKPLEITPINPDDIPKIFKPGKIQVQPNDDIVVCKNCTTVWPSKFNYCPMCAAGLYEYEEKRPTINHNIITCESCYSVYSTIHKNCPHCGEQN